MKTWRGRAAVVVGLALVVAACGDDDDATETTETAAEAATTDAPEPTTAADDDSTEGVAPPTEAMSAEDAELIDAAAIEALDAGGGVTPGMWIGVWDPEQGVHLAAYGDAVADDVPAAVEDAGRIGSITKTFTATAILQQVAAGTLSLDDTIGDVLPDLTEELPEIADITVEQLLAMESGIPEYEFVVLPDVLADPTALVDLDEVVVETVNGGVEPAGTASYSTTNYLILGDMLEAVTEQPVEDVVNEVAAEAGLTTTALDQQDDFTMPDPASAGYVNEFAAESLQAEGVDVEPLGDVSEYNPMWGGAGGSMYSTVEDLGVWASTGFGNDFIPAELAAQRLEAAPLAEGIDYGYGIIDFGDGWYGHSGEILGWNALAAQQPDTGAVFVAIVNESGSLLATAGPALAAFPDLAGAYGL